jgi:Flagellar transcriptional activator (FlhC)
VGSSSTGAFHREYNGNHTPKPLGNQANFVINFCQILFEAKTREFHQGETMRVSDDRYTRDRQRLDLALRLIRHEARTFTIRQWTGLSDDRIRKLYRSYVLNHDAQRVRRHRGKSPRQAAFFFRNTELNFQSAQLASLYLMYGLLCGTAAGLEPHYRVGSLESGALLCQAYEAYLELHVPAGISFEHAWFLLLALARRDEVGISRCGVCGGVRLRDLLAKHRPTCGTCGPAVSAATAASVISCTAPC